MAKRETEAAETVSPAEAEARFEKAIRHALATPPQPHKTPKRPPKAKTGKRSK